MREIAKDNEFCRMSDIGEVCNGQAYFNRYVNNTR